MTDRVLLTPAQRSAIEYSHYLHGYPRQDELVWCWRTHRWRWCEVVDLGRRETFAPWRNKTETWRKQQTGGTDGGYRKQSRQGARRKAIMELLAQHKCLSTIDIAAALGKSVSYTYNAISRHPKDFEKLSNGKGTIQVWRLRNGNGVGGINNGREQTERSDTNAL